MRAATSSNFVPTSSPRCAPRDRCAAPCNSGFTIIELMVTVMITAILAAVAIPAMRTFLQSDRLWTEQTTLVTSLNAARSEAIKQDVAGGIIVCPSSDGATCNNTSAWSNGWIVVSSVANSAPIQAVPAMPTGNSVTEVNGLTNVTFLSNGTVTAAGRFTFCDSRGASQARYTEVATYGRVVSAPTSSLGKNLIGAALTCP